MSRPTTLKGRYKKQRNSFIMEESKRKLDNSPYNEYVVRLHFPMAVTIPFETGAGFSKYIDMSGGLKNDADESRIYAILPNGTSSPPKKTESPLNHLSYEGEPPKLKFLETIDLFSNLSDNFVNGFVKLFSCPTNLPHPIPALNLIRLRLYVETIYSFVKTPVPLKSSKPMASFGK